MKKIMMLLVAALTLTSVASAQTRVDVEGNKKKVAASDADILNDKKNTKPATWITRGNVYYNAVTAPTAALYKGMADAQIKMLVGNPQQTKVEEVAGTAFDVWVYPHFDLYIVQGQNTLYSWVQKTFIVENGLDVAFEAYNKAVELDSKQADKVLGPVNKLIDQYKQEGDVAFSLADYKTAAHAFAKAYDFSVSPLVNAPDTLTGYNAGYVAILAEEYDNALKYLKAINDLGYFGDPAGETYFLMYHAYNGKGDTTAAENALKEGVQKNPANAKLIETLILHYTTTGQDASQMIPLVESALEKEPNNFVFHFGLGMIYDKLGDFEKAATEFQKATELNPDDFSSAFNLAITYIRKAESMIEEVNAIPFNEKARYDEKLAELNSYYKKSLPILQRAYELNPNEASTVELMKNIYFRFRDESPEMMQNYEKYNDLLHSMQE